MMMRELIVAIVNIVLYSTCVTLIERGTFFEYTTIFRAEPVLTNVQEDSFPLPIIKRFFSLTDWRSAHWGRVIFHKSGLDKWVSVSE